MSGKLPSLRKRLAKVEQKLVDVATEQESAKCNCRDFTFADEHCPEEFEAEMNRTCPAHGFRRLGGIVHTSYVAEEENPKLRHLLEIYEQGKLAWKPDLSKFRQVGLRLKHGC